MSHIHSQIIIFITHYRNIYFLSKIKTKDISLLQMLFVRQSIRHVENITEECLCITCLNSFSWIVQQMQQFKSLRNQTLNQKMLMLVYLIFIFGKYNNLAIQNSFITRSQINVIFQDKGQSGKHSVNAIP